MSEVTNRLSSSGIVAVVRKIAPEKVKPLIQSLVDGGITSIEITLDSEDAIATIRELKGMYENQALIGAGTVLNKDQAEQAIEAGAEFIVAPILDREMVEYTKSKGVTIVPGAFTPTEIYHAYQWGADMVKVFPGSILGPQFLKDVSGPLHGIPLMLTGGVNLENIEELFKAGATAVGVGGSLLDKSLVQQEDWDGIRRLTEDYVSKIKITS